MSDINHRSANTPFFYKQGQKVVFLDRDGTICLENPIEKSSEEVKLIPEAAQAIRELNERGFFVVLVTNQPRVARNQVSEQRLGEIHKAMEADLEREEGAKLDLILY